MRLPTGPDCWERVSPRAPVASFPFPSLTLALSSRGGTVARPRPVRETEPGLMRRLARAPWPAPDRPAVSLALHRGPRRWSESSWNVAPRQKPKDRKGPTSHMFRSLVADAQVAGAHAPRHPRRSSLAQFMQYLLGILKVRQRDLAEPIADGRQ